MKVAVDEAQADIVRDLIFSNAGASFDDVQQMVLRNCIDRSAPLWAGFVDGEFVCTWGLIPPTILSDRAYLWLHCTPALEGNEFAFVRHSQVVIEEMLKDYPIIQGHTFADNTRAIRWLRWLGAKFGEPEEGVRSFTILKKRH